MRGALEGEHEKTVEYDVFRGRWQVVLHERVMCTAHLVGALFLADLMSDMEEKALMFHRLITDIIVAKTGSIMI